MLYEKLLSKKFHLLLHIFASKMGSLSYLLFLFFLLVRLTYYLN